MTTAVIYLIVLAVLLAIGAYVLWSGAGRSAADVLQDLKADDFIVSEKNSDGHSRISFNKALLTDDLAQAGIYDEDGRKMYRFRQKLAPLMTSVLGVLAVIAYAPKVPAQGVALVLCAAFIGKMLVKQDLEARKMRYRQATDYYLPVIMERVVMAVQSGLDIIAALRVVIEHSDRSGDKPDPVTRLLKIVYRLTEKGLTFEQALKDVSELSPSSGVRHAFIHLALAQKQGGELIKPLRELSDSTQIFYQESIEEDIAKLPVRATMPLMCTFLGLMICFITGPFVQVISMTKEAKLSGGTHEIASQK